MQYPSSLSRDELIDLATQKHFGNVDAKNLDAVLDCFHDGANLTVQTAHTTHAGKDAIRRMFEDFFTSFEVIVHKDFTCTVDEKNGRITAVFNVVLEDADGNQTLMQNTNFWRIRGDKFQEVFVYMSGANVLV